MLVSVSQAVSMLKVPDMSSLVYILPVNIVTRLRLKGTSVTVLVKRVLPSESRVSMVTFIVCSSVSRKTLVDEMVLSPVAAAMDTVLVHPVLTVARPVVGLKLQPPADRVMRTLEILAVRPSLEQTVSLEMIRLSVALRSTVLVLVILTAWV